MKPSPRTVLRRYQPDKVWRVPGGPSEAARDLARRLDVSPVTAQVLANRGITTFEAAREFLAPDTGAAGYDPCLMPGVEQAAVRIRQGILSEEKIRVYGDYDADGVAATTVLVRAIRSIGGTVDTYIPDRLAEGYGLSEQGIRKAASQGVGLIVTVDCGITAIRQVELARSLGIDVILTDHHEARESVPESAAIVNPKWNPGRYPFRDLAGVGVAFKLASALMTAHTGSLFTLERDQDELLDVVALGTIADVVPLVGENRALVRRGLKRMMLAPSLGVEALIESAGLKGKKIGAGHVGFMLAPRLNAGGRLGSADAAVRLLLTTDAGEARTLAEFLSTENRERQSVEQELVSEGLKMLSADPAALEAPVLVLMGASWHPGVLGLAASRLGDLFYRPCIMMCVDGDKVRASARSIPGFNVFAALNRCADLFSEFGGHEQAAGFSMPMSAVAIFKKRLAGVAAAAMRACPGELAPSLSVDCVVEIEDVTEALVGELEALEPFGYGNPSPVLAVMAAAVEESRPVGSDGKHLRLRFRKGSRAMAGVGYSMAETAERRGIVQGASVDVAFVPEVDEWNGRRSIQAVIKDLRASGGSVPSQAESAALNAYRAIEGDGSGIRAGR